MLSRDGLTHGRLGRIHQPLVQHNRYTAINGPGVATLEGGVVEEVEGQDFAIPNRLPFKQMMNDPTAV